MISRKFSVSEVLKILDLDDKFHQIDVNLHDLEKIEHLLGPFLDDCQNSSPSFGELITLAKEYNGILECYITGTNRDDCRMSCEGIVLRNVTQLDMIELVNSWHSSDELHLSVELNGNFRIRLWWD